MLDPIVLIRNSICLLLLRLCQRKLHSSVVSLYLGVLTVVMGGIKAALALHRRLLNNMMRLPMAFFDTTPKGRIVARFSNDINTLDYSLPFNIKQFIPAIFRVRRR